MISNDKAMRLFFPYTLFIFLSGSLVVSLISLFLPFFNTIQLIITLISLAVKKRVLDTESAKRPGNLRRILNASAGRTTLKNDVSRALALVISSPKLHPSVKTVVLARPSTSHTV